MSLMQIIFDAKIITVLQMLAMRNDRRLSASMTRSVCLLIRRLVCSVDKREMTRLMGLRLGV